MANRWVSLFSITWSVIVLPWQDEPKVSDLRGHDMFLLMIREFTKGIRRLFVRSLYLWPPG